MLADQLVERLALGRHCDFGFSGANGMFEDGSRFVDRLGRIGRDRIEREVGAVDGSGGMEEEGRFHRRGRRFERLGGSSKEERGGRRHRSRGNARGPKRKSHSASDLCGRFVDAGAAEATALTTFRLARPPTSQTPGRDGPPLIAKSM